MTKRELVGRMADSAGITKVAAEKALNGLLDGIKKSLSKKQKVTLVGFGTFAVSKRKGRVGRNPQTGEALRIPAKNVPKFAAGRKLKNLDRTSKTRGSVLRELAEFYIRR